MDASQMKMTKDDQVRIVERSAFRGVWSKIGWSEAPADAPETPAELNVDGPAGVEGRPPITVGEHLEVEEHAQAVADNREEQKQDAADDAVKTAKDDDAGEQGDDGKPQTAAQKKAAEKAKAASTAAGDSNQSPKPTDQ